MGIEIRNMSFQYSKDQVLFKNLNLDLQQSKIYGLKGASGTGKTTFGKLLAKYLEPTRGTIHFKDHCVKSVGSNPIQLISQNPEAAINPKWTLKKLFEQEIKLTPDLQNELSIDLNWQYAFPHELSGGELQRICIARALAAKPRFLIADEITAMLDPVTQAKIWKSLIKIVEKQQLGLLVISHNHDLLNQVCHEQLDIKKLLNQTQSNAFT